MPEAVPLAGELHIEKLEETFIKLIKRHESLRTSFHMLREEPVQRVHEGAAFGVEDLYALHPGSHAVIKDFIRPFALSGAPLLRAGVIKIRDDSYWLLVDMHHIISDGMSRNILVKDFTALAGGKALHSLRIRYKDFSHWQNSEKEKDNIRKQEIYWLKEFEDEIPVLDIPTDYPRPAVLSFAGNAVNFEISVDHTRVLNAFALEEKATLYMVLLSIYNVLLSKLGGQEDIIVGTPAAGRRHVDLEPVMGMFVNTLALRNYPHGKETFREFLIEVKERTLAAFENQDYPFEDLVEKVSVSRNTGHNPIFDVMFAMQTQSEGRHGHEEPDTDTDQANTETPEPRENPNPVAKFDLTLNTVEEHGKLLFTFEYSSCLFKEETIRRFINYFIAVVLRVCENPHERISGIQLMGEEEKQQLLVNFNRTAVDYPKDKTIHRLFEEQAKKSCDGVAVVCVERRAGGVGAAPRGRPGMAIQHLTYKELNEKSDQLAGVLKEKGVLAGDIVAMVLEPSVEMVIGLLGILKAGGAYLPIEPGYPRERIDYTLTDSNAVFLLTAHELLDIYKGTASCAPTITPAACNLHPSLAYVIYTSGSTGRPKGVVVEHRNAVNTLVCRKNEYGMGCDDTSLQLFSYAFDGFVTSKRYQQDKTGNRKASNHPFYQYPGVIPGNNRESNARGNRIIKSRYFSWR
jgi:hypothetical protein